MCSYDTDAPTSSGSKNRDNSRTQTVVKSEIDLGLHFMVPGFVYKFKMIYVSGTFELQQPIVGKTY